MPESNEADLVQEHTIEAFGVTIPVRVELRPDGRPKIQDLDGPLHYRVEVSVRGMFGSAGSNFETTRPGLEWVETQAEEQLQDERDYHAQERAEREQS